MASDSAFSPESTGQLPAAAPSCLSGEQMTVLGDGLLAISRELQERPEAEASSLSQWLIWLDDEGYDQAGFCSALQHLCQQRLSSEACRSLLAQASASAEAPQGLPAAIEHLSEQHPELLAEILELEQRRQSELEKLLATAGGMKTKTKIEIGLAVWFGVGTLGAIGGGVVAQKRQKALDKLAREALDRMKQDVSSHAVDIAQESSAAEILSIKNSGEKIYRLDYRMPLVRQGEDEIVTHAAMCKNIIQKAHANPSLDPIKHSRIASELETRMMACMEPKAYLKKLKNGQFWQRKLRPILMTSKRLQTLTFIYAVNSKHLISQMNLFSRLSKQDMRKIKTFSRQRR